MELQYKEFKIGDLFEYKRGKRIKKADRKKGSIPLITAGKVGYGVSEYIKEHTEYQERKCITVDMFGNSFYREERFFYDDNIIVFENVNLGKYQLLYIKGVMEYLTGEYSYTRQFRVKEIENVGLKLPITDTGEPDWEYMETYMRNIEEESEHIIEMLNSVTLNEVGDLTLEPYDYSAFKIEELFDIKPSKAYKDLKDDLIISTEGGTPFVTTTKETQGIKGYTTLEPLNDAEMISASDTTDHNAIFYREEGWVGRSHVQGLSPKEHVKMNKYTGLYMVTAFRESARVEGYDYGNKFNRKRMNATVINLPITESGDIDFEYMENYMKLKEEESLQKLELLGLIGK